jgi:hypothetical protein
VSNTFPIFAKKNGFCKKKIIFCKQFLQFLQFSRIDIISFSSFFFDFFHFKTMQLLLNSLTTGKWANTDVADMEEEAFEGW